MEKSILSSATKEIKRYHKKKNNAEFGGNNAAIFGVKMCLKKIPHASKNNPQKHKKINAF